MLTNPVYIAMLAFLVALGVVFYALGMIAGAKERAASALVDGGTAEADTV